MSWSLQAWIFCLRSKGEPALLRAAGWRRSARWCSLQRPIARNSQIVRKIYDKHFRNGISTHCDDLSLKGQCAGLTHTSWQQIAIGANPSFLKSAIDLVRAWSWIGNCSRDYHAKEFAVVIARVIFCN